MGFLMETGMNAQQLLRKAILLKAVQFENIEPFTENLTGEQVDTLWSCYDENDELADPISEIRCGGIYASNIKAATFSRHYEIDVNAMKIEGVWVAWDYYYGGGKHGEPEAYDWISDARIVNCEEQEVVKIEYIFSE